MPWEVVVVVLFLVLPRTVNFPRPPRLRGLTTETVPTECFGDMAGQDVGLSENVQSPKGPQTPPGPG